MNVIVDTNILIYAVKFKADIKTIEGELYTLSSVLEELGKLSNKEAKLALKLAQTLKILPSSETADKALLSYAKKGYVIATQDRALQKKLKEQGSKVLCLRQKKYFEVL